MTLLQDDFRKPHLEFNVTNGCLLRDRRHSWHETYTEESTYQLID